MRRRGRSTGMCLAQSTVARMSDFSRRRRGSGSAHLGCRLGLLLYGFTDFGRRLGLRFCGFTHFGRRLCFPLALDRFTCVGRRPTHMSFWRVDTGCGPGLCCRPALGCCRSVLRRGRPINGGRRCRCRPIDGGCRINGGRRASNGRCRSALGWCRITGTLSINKCRWCEQKEQENPRPFVHDGLRRVLVDAFHGDFSLFSRAFPLVLNQTCEIECKKGQEFLADPNVLFLAALFHSLPLQRCRKLRHFGRTSLPPSANGDPVRLVAFREKCRMME